MVSYNRTKVAARLKELLPSLKDADVCWVDLLCRDPNACSKATDKAHVRACHSIPADVKEKVRMDKELLMQRP